jgi:hypothetical protein
MVFALKLLTVNAVAVPVVVKKELVVSMLLTISVLKMEEVVLIVLAFSVLVLMSWETTVLAGRSVVLLIRIVLKPPVTAWKLLTIPIVAMLLVVLIVPLISRVVPGTLQPIPMRLVVPSM